MMSTCLHRDSARIYQFPVGGRAGVERLREEVMPTSTPAPQAVHVACGSWYHDEAIEEDARERQRTR